MSYVVNSVAVNIGVHVSFSIKFPQGICPVVGLLGHMVVLFPVFKGIPILFSVVTVSICISTNITVQKHQFFGPQLSFGPTLTSIHDYWKNRSFDYMDFCWQNDASAF